MSKSSVARPAPAAPTTYNPLSKLAIFGLGCAIAYAVFVIGSALLASASGAPPFVPDALLILPIAGAGLSLLAARQIRNSEGTLSGERLTRWGLWLSVLTGLGYGAFFLSTGLAVQQQANHFLMTKGDETGFFEYLQEGNVNKAFLLTLRWSQRQNISPNDPQKMAIFELPKDARDSRGPLPTFADNDLVHLIMQAGKENKPVQPLGVKLWKYEKGEYLVMRNYRIETSEETAEILVPVKSNDLDAPGETRKWNVLWGAVEARRKLTPLGEKLLQLRIQASLYAQPWVDRLSRGKVEPPITEDETVWSSAPLQGAGPELQKKIAKDLAEFFAGQDKTPRLVTFQNSRFIPWKQDKDGRLQFFFNVSVQVPFRPAANDTPYTAEIQLTIQSKEVATPMEVSQPLTWQPVAFKVLQFRDLPNAPTKKK